MSGQEDVPEREDVEQVVHGRAGCDELALGVWAPGTVDAPVRGSLGLVRIHGAVAAAEHALWGSLTAPDTELFVQLIDRAPDGTLLYLNRVAVTGPASTAGLANRTAASRSSDPLGLDTSRWLCSPCTSPLRGRRSPGFGRRGAASVLITSGPTPTYRSVGQGTALVKRGSWVRIPPSALQQSPANGLLSRSNLGSSNPKT